MFPHFCTSKTCIKSVFFTVAETPLKIRLMATQSRTAGLASFNQNGKWQISI